MIVEFAGSKEERCLLADVMSDRNITNDELSDPRVVGAFETISSDEEHDRDLLCKRRVGPELLKVATHNESRGS